MLLKKGLQPLDLIQNWFAARCDGVWEHHHGLTLETTDNPGWLLTIDEPIEKTLLEALSIEAKARWNAECVQEPGKPEVYGAVLSPPPVRKTKLKKAKIKVYAASLNDCLSAATHIMAALKVKAT